jgi:ankyrin repeat protein
VKLLLFNEANIEGKTDEGKTGLFFGAQNGHFEIVKYLINNGADINVLTAQGFSIVKEAILQAKPNIVDLLFNKGAENHLPFHSQLMNFYFPSTKFLYCYHNLTKSLSIMTISNNSPSFNTAELAQFIFALPLSFSTKDAKLSKAGSFYRFYNIYHHKKPNVTGLFIFQAHETFQILKLN